MKSALYLLLLVVSICVNDALAQGDSCKSRIKGNTEYAQWGIDLRHEMLNKCGKRPSKSCITEYEKIIEAQNKKNLDLISKAFPSANAYKNNPAYGDAIIRSLDLDLAARNGLTGSWNSAKEIADVQYRLCKGLPLVDSEPSARGARGLPPMPPPMMPMEPSISSRLSPMQPEMSGGSPFGSCNNYNYLGPNGQPLYCQQCCGADGNCQTICN